MCVCTTLLSVVSTSRAFLYIMRGKVAACISAERLEHAFSMLRDPVIEQEQENQPSRNEKLASQGSASTEPADAILCSKLKRPAVLGIAYMWVNKNHRRLQLASRLMDVVRSKFVFGYAVALKECAFCQPTRLGLLFARKYVGSADVLVY